jgi:hypothetical protein
MRALVLLCLALPVVAQAAPSLPTLRGDQSAHMVSRPEPLTKCSARRRTAAMAAPLSGAHLDFVGKIQPHGPMSASTPARKGNHV